MMFADYFKEKDGKDTLEVPDVGFMTYFLNGKECYIEHVYVVPMLRKSNEAKQMLDQVAEIAKAAGCEFLTGSVRPSAKNSTESLKALLAVGFQLYSAQNDGIIFKKELNHG